VGRYLFGGDVRFMVMGSKNHRKRDEVDYRKVLDRTDPFDQLLLELGRGGTLDIGLVVVGQDQHPEEPSEYNKKVLRQRGRHST
jgi:hypothetical protein